MKFLKYFPLLLLSLTCYAYDVTPNSTYLSNTKYGTDQFNPLGNKVDNIRQNFDDRMRNYTLNETYGLNGYYEELNYYNSMTGFQSSTFHEIYHTIYTNQFNPYVQNLKSSNRNGDISQPIQDIGGVVAVGTGNANTLVLDKDTKVITKTDVPNEYAEARVENKNYSLFVNYNLKNPADQSTASALGTEREVLGFTKTLPFTFTDSVTYGASSNVVRNTVGYQVIKNVGVFYDYNLGNSSGVVSQSTIRSGYGIKF
jgi:hypothetical protein